MFFVFNTFLFANFQDKDDPEKWVELKRQEMEYEKRRAHLISYYESVKHAQSVQVDDIPLPTLQVIIQFKIKLFMNFVIFYICF